LASAAGLAALIGQEIEHVRCGNCHRILADHPEERLQVTRSPAACSADTGPPATPGNGPPGLADPHRHLAAAHASRQASHSSVPSRPRTMAATSGMNQTSECGHAAAHPEFHRADPTPIRSPARTSRVARLTAPKARIHLSCAEAPSARRTMRSRAVWPAASGGRRISQPRIRIGLDRPGSTSTIPAAPRAGDRGARAVRERAAAAVRAYLGLEMLSHLHASHATPGALRCRHGGSGDD